MSNIELLEKTLPAVEDKYGAKEKTIRNQKRVCR